MRKLLTVITALLLLVNSFSFYAEAAEQLPDSNHFPQTPSAAVTQGNSIGSTILVGLHLGAAATDLDTTLSSVDVQSVEPLFPDAPTETALSHIYRLRLTSTSDVPSTLARLMVHPSVDYAEVDQVAHTVTTTPNDPLLPGQWALPQISAPAAWDVITGTPTVVIAMLDTGIDVDHPDLVGRLWSNPGETPNNGIDDDTNGYIDDVHGWNFIAQTNEVDDDDGHGTKVAGVAVAETNNGVGVAGVCWNCRIMVVKVVQPGGFANYSDIALGVYYAVSKGADVINISLGGAADSATLRAAVEAATETAVVVAAVGDGNTSTQFYPAAYPDVLAVGGTTAADTRASFSNYGQWVDVAAPAVMITTTLNGGNYGPASGTSMAAPFVSGLAGLISSQRPDWTPSLVQSQIVHTTDAIAATGLGSGRINAAAAVTQIPRPLLTIASTAINGDALGRPTPGEGASLMINLKNDWLDATAVTGVLSTTDPYVTITNNTAAFGDIPAGGTGSGGSVYSFTVASGAGYNYPIAFTLHLSANSEAYAVTLPLTITTRSANQIVGGTIVTHTVWTSDKTYIVNNNVGVAPGISLTIQPGTVVRFNGNYSLNIGGTLIADGTQAQPIRFMSNSTSTWGRILFDNPSVDATATVSGTYLGGNILRWVWVESAGQGIGCNNATPYLAHVTLTGGGMVCAGGDRALWIQESDLGGNVQISKGSGVDPLSWATRASMPTARRSLGVATAPNGSIYAIGGYVDGNLATVEEYNPTMDTWATRTPMPTARHGLAVVAAPNDRLYAIGGIGGVEVVEEYDPATDTWATRAPLPTPRHSLATTIAPNGRVYAIGGSNGSALATVEEYDPATDTWTTRAPMPTARLNLAVATAFNGKLYAIGGENPGAGGYLAVVEEYDPATDTWTTRTPMPTSRAILSAVTAPNGRIYAIGGYGGPGVYLATVEEYNPATNTWTSRTSMPTARYSPGAAVAPNARIYVIGGYNNNGNLATVEEYTPNTGDEETEYYYNILDSTLRSGLTLPDISKVLASTVFGSINAGNGSLIHATNISGGVVINGTGIIASSAAGDTISMVNGTAENNTVHLGNISMGSGSALNNSIVGGGISIGSNGVAHDNSVENSPNWGIQASGNSSVEHNRVIDCADGIQANDGLVQGNLIANSSGVGLQVGGARVLSNTLTGNGGNTLVVTSGSPTIQGNNLEFNRGLYDLVNNTANPVVASGNWWGTTDSGTIGDRIFDYLDDFNLGQVTYIPVLTESARGAPAYVRAITLTPSSPVGIETVTFDVEFSREMDTGVVPRLALVNSVDWATRASMHTARSAFAAATATNGRIYAISGYNCLNTIEEYNPETDTWTTRAPMSTGRHNLAVASASNGQVYAIGGSVGWDNLTTKVEAYDPATDTWTTRASMPTARQYHAAATAPNGRIYVIGGWTSGGQPLATVEGYDPATDTWQTRAPMPTPRWNLATATGLNGRIYAIGGYNGQNRLATVEEYDPETNTWRTRAPMPTAREWLAAATAPNGRIYAMGGYFSTGSAMSVVEEYDPVTNVWVTRTAMPTARYALVAATAPSGRIYAIGGVRNGNSLATVEEYTPWVEHADFNGSSWPALNQYRTVYDFSALISRGVYSINVQSAWGTDGIEIAPNSTYTFTVDYIGDPETTTPPTPLVRACAALTTTTLSAQWTVPTAQAIGLYRYAIGTAPGRSDVTNWITTTLTSVIRTNLNLLPDQTYYFSVRARNTGGIWSDMGASNGVIAGAGGCPQVNFTAAPTSGMAPMPVAFAPHITGTVTSHIWSYGNNITGTQASPVYTYTLPGTYTVTLEVFGPGGWAKVAKEAYISVVPDTVPPSGTLTIAGGGAHIATTTVALTIAASDPSGLDGMRFSNNGTSFSPWVPYNQTYAWTLASGDGPKTVHVQVRDVPGNTASFTSTIILDTTPPTAAVAALPAFTGGTIFTVAWAGSDLYAGVADFDLQVRENAEGIWTDWLTHTTMISAPFTGTHGASYYFRARARDTLGNLGQYTAGNGDTHITIDLLPPVGSVLMNDGAMYTNDLSVRLDLSATDLSEVEAFQLSNDGLTYSEWFSYTTVYSWTLTAGDETKTVYARFRDMVGHASEAVTDTIILDSTPPEGSIVINEGAEYTNSVSVTLVLSATDFVGITGMALSNDGVTFSEWLSFTSPYSWPLAGSDGVKIVYARFLDPAGNSVTVSDTIMLDRAGPMGSLTIADGATVVPSPTVVLHSDVSDTNGVVEMQFSNDGTSYSGWVAFNSLHTWMLSSGDGEKTVHGRYRDTAGNESSVLSDTVVLDTHAPVGSVLVNDGAMYTHDLNVTLNLSATDLSEVEAFQLSNDGLTYSEWFSYTTVYSWTLTAGDETKTVYARFRDMVGHASEAVTDTIILHTEPPTGSVLIADGIWATASPSVTLSITATDSLGVADICIANDTESCTDWEPFVTWREWLLQPVDGVRTVTVQIRDLAGVTVVLTDAILLDTTPPMATVDSLPPFQTVLNFTVSWSGTDLTEIANFDIQVRHGDQPWSDWLTSTTALSATFTGLDGHTYYFRARARDIPGNLGVYTPGNGDTSTHVDSRRPEGSISIDGGAIDTTSQNVVLLLTTNDATEMAFSDDGVDFSAWEPFATTRLYVLASGDGLKTVSARFRNVVGNVSEYNDSITLNTAIPGDVGVSINNDDPVTEQITVTLTIKAPPNTQYMMVSNSSRFATAEWEPYAATRTWVLAYHPYVTVYPVYVRFRNVDGTVSANYDDIITLHLLEPPPPVDSVPPTGSMVVNAGAEETAIQDVLLDVLAADNPGGMGVQWVYLREWKYDPVAVQWVIVRNSGWLPYTENSIAWTLAPGTGVKYIGAWFADGANNVSNPVVIDSINLVLPGDTIGEAQVTQYRRTFEPGQRISMTLTVNNGDADLYIWLPESIAAPDYWSNLPGTATERLAFTAIEGEYLVEVHGYASSVFTLDIATDEGGGGGLGQASATPEQSVSNLTTLASKPLPPRPLVITRPGDPVPDESPRQYIYLPLVVRGYQ